LKHSNIGSPRHDAVTFDAAQIGQWSDELRFAVTSEQLISYAEAINDDSVSGKVAPPVFAVVPGGLIWKDVVRRAVIGDPGTSSMHGEHDLYIHEQIQAGMTLVLRAALWAVVPKATGTLVTVKVITADADGRPINDQYLTLFFRGITGAKQAGHAAPDHAAPANLADKPPAGRVVTHVDPDQSLRYARASQDYSAYHIDDAAARAAGFPRIFLHGLCTMAMAGNAAVKVLAQGHSERLTRLAVRFTSVVYPGQDIATTFWRVPSASTSAAFAFEVTDSDGTAVVRNGRAELSIA
jgi:acyl dehydratase